MPTNQQETEEFKFKNNYLWGNPKTAVDKNKYSGGDLVRLCLNIRFWVLKRLFDITPFLRQFVYKVEYTFIVWPTDIIKVLPAVYACRAGGHDIKKNTGVRACSELPLSRAYIACKYNALSMSAGRTS